jgi:hypothetical protein
MYKSDVKDAYKLVPAKLEDLRLQGFSFMNMMFCENMMAFGGKPSVANYDAVGNTIYTLALVNSSIPYKLADRCVDDVLCVSPSNKDWGEELMRNYRELCNDVNIELAPNCPNFEKAFERTTYGKVLGKFFDTETLCWSVPDDKKRETIDDIHHVFFNKSNLLTLQSIYAMKNFRHELNSVISLRIQDPEKLLHLFYKAKQELNVWEGFLSDENKWMPICPPE